MVDELLEGLLSGSAKQSLPECTLDPTEILKDPDMAWQRRVRAAAQPIPCELDMGSFGPLAYSVEHLVVTSLGSVDITKSNLCATNRSLAVEQKRWVMIDAHSGGCGATVSAIQVGLFVKTAFEAIKEEISTFEALTGQINLGSVILSAAGFQGHIFGGLVPRVKIIVHSGHARVLQGSRVGATSQISQNMLERRGHWQYCGRMWMEWLHWKVAKLSVILSAIVQTMGIRLSGTRKWSSSTTAIQSIVQGGWE